MKADWRFLILLCALVFTCAVTGAVIWLYPDREENSGRVVDPAALQELQRKLRYSMINRQYFRGEVLAEQFIRLAPQNSSVQKILGRIYFETGRSSRALELFRALRIHMPTDPVLSNNIGMILLYNRRFEQAIRELRNAYRLSGGKEYIAFNLAHAYALAGLRDQAAAYAVGFQQSSGSTVSMPLEALFFDKQHLSSMTGKQMLHDNFFHSRQVRVYE